MGVHPERELRGVGTPPLRVKLSYLVTTWGEDEAAAHSDLGHLLFAAMETADMNVSENRVSSKHWIAFSVPPRPAFVIEVPLYKKRSEPYVPPVRVHPDLVTAPTVTLSGVVLGVHGSTEVPLAGAVVRIPATDYRARCDVRGRFRIDMVPAEPPVTALEVIAKGRQRLIELPTLLELPLTLRVPMLED